MGLTFIILLLLLLIEFGLLLFIIFKKFKRKGLKFPLIILCLFLLVLTGKFLLFPSHEPLKTSGQYEVLTKDHFFINQDVVDPYAPDHSVRELPATIWYPAGAENQSAPLLIFSHGAMGTRESNLSLYQDLASHGYVVVSADHLYQGVPVKNAQGKMILPSAEFLKEMSSQGSDKDPAETLKIVTKWMDLRKSDLNFLLDSMLYSVEDGLEAIQALLDKETVFLAGHSLGGAGALALNGERQDLTAIVSLEAPYFSALKGVADNGNFIVDYQNSEIPVLNVYSDTGIEIMNKVPIYGGNLLATHDPQTENIHIQGVGHLGMTDLSMVSPFLTGILDGEFQKKPARETIQEINNRCLEFLESSRK